MDRGNPLSDRQRREPTDVAGEERIARDKERVGPLLGKGREGCLEIVFAADVQDESRHAERLRRRLRVLCLKLGLRTFGVNQYSYDGSIWQSLAQQLQLFRFQVCARVEENAGDIASRPVEACHETDLDRIVTCHDTMGIVGVAALAASAAAFPAATIRAQLTAN